MKISAERCPTAVLSLTQPFLPNLGKFVIHYFRGINMSPCEMVTISKPLWAREDKQGLKMKSSSAPDLLFYFSSCFCDHNDVFIMCFMEIKENSIRFSCIQKEIFILNFSSPF